MKKIIGTMLFSALIGGAFAQETSFSLSGDILGLDAEKVYLETRVPVTKEVLLDSAYVRDGKFEFSRHLSQPMYVVLRASDNSFGTRFWIENSKITINGVSGQDLDIQGSATQDMMNLWNKRTAHVIEAHSTKMNELQEARSKGDEALVAKLTKEADDIRIRQYRLASEEIVKEFPDSYFVLNQVFNAGVQEKYSYEDLSRFYNYLSTRLKNEPMGKAIAERIEKLKLLTIGHQFPGLSLPDLNGKTVAIGDYRGKYTLVTFGAAGLKSYDDQLSGRRHIYDQFKARGFELVDILFNKDIDETKAIQDEGIVNWSLLSDFKSWSSEVARQYSIESLPQNYLLDPQGKIIARDLFEGDLTAKLKEIL